MAIDYTGRKYDIIPYDPPWPVIFAVEEANLRPIFGDLALAIEHVGSTSVPGLAGKPTIDILVLVNDISVIDPLNSKMEELGYKALGEYVKKGARLFVKEQDSVRLCNLHVFQKDHSHVKEMLDLRNYFRTHPEAVREYSDLKNRLFAKYPDDYGTYRKFKDEWMEKLKNKISH